MRVLITGGGGFIGSHLVDLLLEENGVDITVLDDFSTGTRANLEQVSSSQVEIIEGDIRVGAVVEEAVREADEVYHLAAAVGVKKIIEHPLDSLRTNLAGTKNVLEAAADDGTPTFLASSSEIYGKPGDELLTENDDRTLGPTTTARWSYAAAKAADEFLALALHDQADLPVVIGRFFNVVGPGQTGQYGMVIPRFVQQALAGDPVTVYGDGTQSRSFGHVRDTVEIVQELMWTPETWGDVFNIGATRRTTINELAERVIQLTASDSEITHVPFEEVYGPDFEEPNHREPDVTKLQETVGRAPDGDLDRIITDVIKESRADPGVAADV